MKDKDSAKALAMAPELIFQLCVVALVIHYAWMSDDAYITLRSVDNFVSGRGLTWNPGQRVQVFTHPLWAFVLSAFYYFTREAFFTTLGVSIALGGAVVVLLPRVFNARGIHTLPLLVALAMSRSFIDYSTSGLENPLTHVLLLVFLLCARRGSLTTLALIAALGCLNRLDTALLFAPVILWRMHSGFATHGRAYLWTVLRAALLGGAPLWLWEAFSLLYFGSLVPNTALAKLGHGYPRGEVIQQGVFYVLDLVREDPATAVAIAAGVVVAGYSRKPLEIAVAAGVVAYLLYVVWVGGDFMRGRFFSAPFLLSVALLGRNTATTRWSSGAFGLAVVFSGIFARSPPPRIGSADKAPRKISEWGIADERRYYADRTGLFEVEIRGGGPKHGWRWTGEKYDPKPGRNDIRAAYVKSNIGIAGFYTHPDVTLVDPMGLTDPLLARLPARRKVDWRVGHFARPLPAGYLRSVRTGKDKFSDENLGRLWEQLELVTRGDLFASDRLLAIWELNTGLTDELVDRERYFYYGAKKVTVDAKVRRRHRPHSFRGTGVRMRWETPSAPTSELELELSRGTFEIRFYAGDDYLDAKTVVSAAESPEPDPPKGKKEEKKKGKKKKKKPPVPLQSVVVAVPPGAQEGFDSIRVVPWRGPSPYFVKPPKAGAP